MAEKQKPVAVNRQAARDFFLEKTYEAGLQLRGDEVKSLREGKANLKGSFARVEAAEVYIFGMHINPYKFAREEHDPVRRRKLLLNKSEIKQIIVKSQQKGYTIVPTKIYFRRGYAKVEIALGRGKKHYDKRTALKEKEVKREMDKAVRDKTR
jgi:SsrA-binding protein